MPDASSSAVPASEAPEQAAAPPLDILRAGPTVAVLDDPAEWAAFGRPVPGREGEGLWESYLAIEGMHCAACTLVVEEALQALPGVASVQVNGGAATSRIEWWADDAATARPSDWLAALRRAGYAALPAGDLLDAEPRRRAQRKLLWRWLVAGFGMMQAMMYAYPLYIAGPGEIPPDQEALLRWGAWMMTVPVMLFSCGPFFSQAWRDLMHRRVGMDVPVAMGLIIAFLASTAATFEPTGPWGREVWYDSVTMFVFFLLSGRLLEARLRDHTAGALEALARALPASVLRWQAAGAAVADCAPRSVPGSAPGVTPGDSLGPGRPAAALGDWVRVPVRRLSVGDRVRVLPGEAVPADGRIECGESRFDEALLTGESAPQRRGPGDALVAGSHNLESAVDMRVERLGADTRHATIVALMERASVDKPRLARLADRIAAPFLLGVMLAAAGAAAWWWSAGPAHALSVAVAVLVVTCPCALSLATPAATLAAAGALARRGVLVRQLQALEAGAAVDTLVFDKTGTLTQDRMTVAAICCREGVSPEQALALAAPLAAGSLHPASRALADRAASECGNVWVDPSTSHGARDTDPTADRLADPRADRIATLIATPTADHLTEYPGQGVEGQVAGRKLRLGSAAFCWAPALPDAELDHPQVHLADERGWLARFDLEETLRPDAVQTLERLRATGLDLRLLSGDRPSAVARLAERAGISHWRGGCTPEDKMAEVRALQQGRKVAMVGDGMNDGPVLALADLSVAMGEGLPLAQAHADVVVQGGRLMPVADLLALARRTQQVVRRNLAWAATYNAAAVPLAVAGLMPAWLAGLGMAASSLLVVAHSATLARRARGPGH